MDSDQIEIYWKDSNALPSKPFVWKGYIQLLQEFGEVDVFRSSNSSKSPIISDIQRIAWSKSANAIVDVEIKYVKIKGNDYREAIGTAIWYNKEWNIFSLNEKCSFLLAFSSCFPPNQNANKSPW